MVDVGADFDTFFAIVKGFIDPESHHPHDLFLSAFWYQIYAPIILVDPPIFTVDGSDYPGCIRPCLTSIFKKIEQDLLEFVVQVVDMECIVEVLEVETYH